MCDDTKSKKKSASRSRASSATSSVVSDDAERPKYTWQNPRNDVNLRQEGVIRIGKIIEKGVGDKSRDQRREYRVTLALEQLCYENATSKEEYCDISKFKILLHRMAAEKAKRRRGRQWSDKMTREQQQFTLLEILGSPMENDDETPTLAHLKHETDTPMSPVPAPSSSSASSTMSGGEKMPSGMDGNFQSGPPPPHLRHHRRGSSGGSTLQNLNSLFNRSSKLNNSQAFPNEFKADLSNSNNNNINFEGSSSDTFRRPRVDLKVETAMEEDDSSETFGVQGLHVSDNFASSPTDSYSQTYAPLLHMPFSPFSATSSSMGFVPPPASAVSNRSLNNAGFCRTDSSGAGLGSPANRYNDDDYGSFISSSAANGLGLSPSNAFFCGGQVSDGLNFNKTHHQEENFAGNAPWKKSKIRSQSDSTLPRYSPTGEQSTSNPAAYTTEAELSGRLETAQLTSAPTPPSAGLLPQNQGFFGPFSLGPGNATIIKEEGGSVVNHALRQRTPRRRRSAMDQSITSFGEDFVPQTPTGGNFESSEWGF